MKSSICVIDDTDKKITYKLQKNIPTYMRRQNQVNQARPKSTIHVLLKTALQTNYSYIRRSFVQLRNAFYKSNRISVYNSGRASRKLNKCASWWSVACLSRSCRELSRCGVAVAKQLCFTEQFKKETWQHK